MPRFALAALALLVAGGCAPTAPAPSPTGSAASPLVGRWDMEAVYDRGADVTAEANPAGDRYIVLRPDGSFESGGQPYGLNTGRWTYTPRTRTLALDSDLGPDDDSRWIVTLRDDVMEWDGDGSAFARRFRITAVRAD
ncbi:hypothetical protein [Rubrivirga sp. IMCC43871]|uniref:hypothetical protein n=1 Tax=Rubrivirga sp. IMCC43871 TaxID=3391575 RepID=UPI0039900CA4